MVHDDGVLELTFHQRIDGVGLAASGEVLQGELAVAAAEEREEAKLGLSPDQS